MNLSGIEQSVYEHFLGYKSTLVFTSQEQQSFRLSRKEVWFFKGTFINPTTLLVKKEDIKNVYDKQSLGREIDLDDFINNRLSDPFNQLVLFSPKFGENSLYKNPADPTLGYGFTNYRRANQVIFSFLSGTNVFISLSFPIVDPSAFNNKFDFILHDARYPNIITGLPVGFSYVAATGSVTTQYYNNTGAFDSKVLNSTVSYDYHSIANSMIAPSNTVFPIYDKETVKSNIKKYRYYFI